MAAPILWATGIAWFFMQESLHAHKTSRFRGVFGFLRGGGPGGWDGSANFIFMGVGIFLKHRKLAPPTATDGVSNRGRFQNNQRGTTPLPSSIFGILLIDCLYPNASLMLYEKHLQSLKAYIANLQHRDKYV